MGHGPLQLPGGGGGGGGGDGEVGRKSGHLLHWGFNVPIEITSFVFICKQSFFKSYFHIY